MARYNIGDIVKLKSGGPNMTVTALPTARTPVYYTRWFAGSKDQSAPFPEDALLAVTVLVGRRSN